MHCLLICLWYVTIALCRINLTLFIITYRACYCLIPAQVFCFHLLYILFSRVY